MLQYQQEEKSEIRRKNRMVVRGPANINTILFNDHIAHWMWPSTLGGASNHYVRFRHEFVLPKSIDQAEIIVSCDTNYVLKVNDEFIDCGQYHDFPDHKTCDVLSLNNLKPGKNVLAFLVYYQGENSFQYIKGAPGLIYQLTAGDVTISSGKDALYRIDPNYKSGPIDKITMQLGYTFEYDARGSDDWTHLSDEDVVPADNRPVRGVRPIEKLLFGKRIRPRIIAQGTFMRKCSDGIPVAELMQTDYLSARHPSQVFDTLGGGAVRLKYEAVHDADGVYLVFDLQREEVGLLDLDLEAAAGTIVDIAWGEHLDDLRVRAHVGERNFACRYICKDGRQSFTHYFTRLAGRYLQLHFSKFSSGMTIHYAGLIPVEYPIERKGSFVCSDSLHNKIYDTCVRTLHLCMHEHYEDCPWREQALYAMDMRNQALAGYYCFTEYDFPAASIDLLARSLESDDFLELCAPAEIPITIPVFSLAWVLAAADHYQHSGNADALRRWYPCVKTILDKRAESIYDGLLPSPRGKRYWHFYDWADGLDGCVTNDCNTFFILNAARYDAPLNLFYILALDATAMLAGALGDDATKEKYQSLANSLREKVHDRFWDADHGSYLTYAGESVRAHNCELTQALAILAGVCPEDIADALRERLASKDNNLVKTTLSYSLYKFEALLTDQGSYRNAVFKIIEDDWGYMLSRGATSFWETLKGSSDFDNAGSLCHGWSGIPVYFYHRYPSSAFKE